ncbi:hypothetical protein HDU96_006414 [Phlyctochytrium bullatum]|nr:hypothetical protein HDU96_006414 [Phlyctochytrium bullatum]
MKAQAKEKKANGRDGSGGDTGKRAGSSSDQGGKGCPEPNNVDGCKAGEPNGENQTPAEVKPKIDPEKLKFLQEPVTSEIFSRFDRALEKVVKSLPNLAVQWRRNQPKLPPPTANEAPQSIFAVTDLKEPPTGEADANLTGILNLQKESELVAEPARSNDLTSPTSATPVFSLVEVMRKRTRSLSKLQEDQEYCSRGLQDQNLIKALMLRERRLKRRRDRAAGVPPDPNDSDDSLLAELKETTDDKLFPGVSFDDELDLAEAVNDPSQFSTQLQFKDPRMLETSKGKVLNPSRRKDLLTAEGKLFEPIKADSEPEDLFRTLTPNSLRRYEKSILKKHYKNGVLTMFKGKDEMKVSHAKVVAKKEIDTIRRAAKAKEEQLVRLEGDLAMCRAQLAKGTAEASRLARELKAMVDKEPRLKVSGLLVGKRQTDRLLATPEDPLDFEIPDEPHLNQNRAFRALKEEYLANKELVARAAQAIPVLEEAIIPTEHELAALQLRENKLRDLDEKLRDADAIEDFEYQVLEKYKKLHAQRKAEKRRRREEREREEEQRRKEEAARRQEEYEKILSEKRELLKRRYEETKTMHDTQRRQQEEEWLEKESRRANAMQSLVERISKIRRSLERAKKLKESKRGETAESIHLCEGQHDLAESIGVRRMRQQLNRRKMEADSSAQRKRQEQENRRQEIYRRLLREEVLLNREEYARKEERELHRALSGLIASDKALEPSFDVEILDKALKKRKEEMKLRIQRVRDLEQERFNSIMAATTIPDALEDSLPVHIPVSLGKEDNSVADSKNEKMMSDTVLQTTFEANGQTEKPSRRVLPRPQLKKHMKPASSLQSSTLYNLIPFVAEPAEVIFADYDPEKVYRKKVLITNTSCQVNTFKLLPLPVDIASYFEVSARPPGRMSAGMVTEVEFIFRPPPGYDQDVANGLITFAAEHGGNFTIRIGCSVRKCKPRIATVGGTGLITQKPKALEMGKFSTNNSKDTASAKGVDASNNKTSEVDESHSLKAAAFYEGSNKIVIDFGTCVLGDTVTRILEVANGGALQTDFEVAQVDSREAEALLLSLEHKDTGDKATRDQLMSMLASKYLKSESSLTDLDAQRPEETSSQEPSPTLAELSPTASCDADTSPTVVDPADLGPELVKTFSVAKNERGVLNSYKSVMVHLEFAPTYVEPLTLQEGDINMAKEPPKKVDYKAFYVIRFKLPNVTPLVVECRAQHLESPLFLDNNEIDFGVCFVGSTYKLPLVLYNRSTIAFKFWMEALGMDRKMTMADPQGGHNDSADLIGSCIASDGIDSEAIDTASRDVFSEVSSGGRTQVGFAPGSPHTTGEQNGRLSEAYLRNLDNATTLAPPMLASFANMNPNILTAINGPILNFQDSPENGKRRRILGKKKGQGRSKRSDSMTIQIPHFGEVEVSPRLAFVQPHEPFTVWCKIRPSRAAALSNDFGLRPFRLPMLVKFNNHGIESPLSLSLVGQVTTSDLNFILPHGSSSDLSFGTCSTFLSKEVPVRVWNQSALPQVARFISSTTDISVVTNRRVATENGLIVIPALSQVVQKIRFEPREPGVHEIRLICQTNWDRRFEIVCGGLAVRPPVKLSNTFIQFRTTSMGSFATARVKLIRERLEKAVKAKTKEAWSDDSSIPKLAFNELDGDEQESIVYEFGEPQLVNIRTRNGDYISAEELERIQKEIDANLKSESSEALDAVAKANKAGPKQIKLSLEGSSACIFEETFNSANFSQLFHQEETIVHNKRLVQTRVTGTAEAVAAKLAASGKLPPAIGPNDAPPIDVSPRRGTIAPGKSVSVDITLCPPTITALAALRSDAEKSGEAQSPEEASPVTSATQVRPSSANKFSSEKPSRSRQGTAGGERQAAKLEEMQPSKGSQNIFGSKFSIDQLNAVKLYKAVDDTCLTFLVPCTVKRVYRPDNSSSRPKSVDGKDGDSNTLYLEVVAPIVRPDILLIDPDSGLLDFDKVPVGKEASLRFTIQNISKQKLKLQHSGLSAAGPFSLVKPLTDLEPEASQTIELSFNPMGEATFLADFIVFTTTTQVRARLQGQGIVPQYQIEPSESSFAFGDVALGDVATKTFRIINIGSYPLHCTLTLSTVNPLGPYPRTHGTVNFNRQNAFSVSSNSLCVQPGARQEITIKFNPDRESDLYFDYLCLDFYGNPQTHKIKLHGRCWDTSTAVMGYDPQPETKEENRFALPPKFELEFAYRVYTNTLPQPTTYYDLYPHERPANQGQIGGDGISGAGALGSSPPAAAARAGSAEAPKKGKGNKDKEKETTLANLPEEFVGDLLRLTSREMVRYCVISCPWKKRESRNTWLIELKELVIGNLKPASFTKPDSAKRSPSAEFTIEPYAGTFEYSEYVNDYIPRVRPQKAPGDTVAKFTFSETKGTLELGTTRPLRIQIHNPVKEFWNIIKSYEDMTGLKITDSSPEEQPLNVIHGGFSVEYS